MSLERTSDRQAERVHRAWLQQVADVQPERPIVIVVQAPAEPKKTVGADRLARDLLISAALLLALGAMALFSVAAAGSSMGATALGWGLVIGFALGAMAVILAAEHFVKGR